jgi:hypothetical protein
MNVSNLSYFTKLKQIEMKITPGELYIRQKPAEMEIEQRPAELSIRTKPAEIQVDLTPLWEDLGLERPLTFARNQVRRSNAELLEAIGQTARDGDRMRDAPAAGEKDVLSRILNERYARKAYVEVILTAVPRQRPQIDITAYPPDIRVEPQKPVVRVSHAEVDVELIPTEIDIRLKDRTEGQ